MRWRIRLSVTNHGSVLLVKIRNWKELEEDDQTSSLTVLSTGDGFVGYAYDAHQSGIGMPSSCARQVHKLWRLCWKNDIPILKPYRSVVNLIKTESQSQRLGFASQNQSAVLSLNDLPSATRTSQKPLTQHYQARQFYFVSDLISSTHFPECWLVGSSYLYLLWYWPSDTCTVFKTPLFCSQESCYPPALPALEGLKVGAVIIINFGWCGDLGKIS